MRSMVEGASAERILSTLHAPTTALRAVPLPRCAALHGGG